MRQLKILIAALSGSWRKRALAGLGVVLAFALLQFGAARLTQAQQGVSDFDHASTGYVLNAQHQNVRCETCHTNGTFKGTPKDCVSCHGWNNPRAKFSVMPTSHIPTGNTSCESCHAATQAQFSDASRTFSHANVVSLTCINCHSSRNPHPGVVTNPNDATHTAAFALNQGCDKCHTTAQFVGTKIPANHIPTAAVACSSCHIGGDYQLKPSVTNIHAYAPSTSSNCVQCHSAANAAFYRTADMVIPSPAIVANHIPMGGASCESCHVGAGSSITNTPVTAGSGFGGSLFNHAGATASCATCHGASVTPTTFYGVSPRAIGDLQPAHVPASAACETCHLSGAPAGLVPAPGMTTFANAQFSHAGISSGCATCHGPNIDGNSFYGITSIIAMPPTSPNGASSHLPTSTTCENCHALSKPAGMVPANSSSTVGVNSLFRTPEPTAAMIHADTTASCSTCHESGTWMGMTLPYYARNFTTKQASGTLYRGFHTRPVLNGGLHAIDDGTHPAGECSQCHGNTTAFGGPSLPTGHIPYASSAGCSDCHNPFGTSPTVAAIHAKIQSLSTNCEQCHSVDNAARYASTTAARPIKTPAPNHIPMGSLGCASCHVGANTGIPTTPVTASSFAGGGFLHTGITSGCGECHGANVVAGTFDGITPMTVSGQTPLHVPVSSNVGCETCHANSIPSGLVTTTGYVGPTFAGGKYIHTGVTTGCATCHGAGAGPFKGISNMVVMPSTAAPNGHIPSSTVCENCHLGSVPTGLLTVSGSPAAVPGSAFANSPPTGSMIHANGVGGCNSCHEAGNTWLGMSAYPRVPSTKNLSNPAQLYNGFNTRPAATASGYSMADSSHPAGAGECSTCHGNTVAFGSPALPTKHIPYASTATCADCHGDFSNRPTIAAIHNKLQSASTNCAQCHSETNAAAYSSATWPIVRPATNHVPMRNLGCESCHVGTGTGILTTPVTATSFGGSLFSHTGMSSNCAECHGPNVTAFQGITSLVKMPPTSPAVATSHIPSSTTCENCHLGSMPSTRVAANAPSQPPGSGFRTPVPTSTMIHAGISGSCSTCHESNMVWMSVTPATQSTPFKGFHSRPQAGANTYWYTDSVHPPGGDCSSCHTGFVEWSTSVKPANHIPTANVACANCHTSANYSTMPTLALIHANAPSSSTNCAQCHSAANAQLYNTTAMTIKAPDTNHIPMGTLGCESCHVGSNSSLTLPVQNNALFTNSAFSHTGVTNGCATCHGNITGSTFQGGQIPVTMTTPTLTPVHVPNVANLDCGICHTAIPTGLSRIGSTSTTFAGGKYSHSGITNGCDTCHGNNISGSSFKGITSIVVLPSTTSGPTGHIPSSVNANCETCHLGSTPAALVNANATTTVIGSTKFRLPAPTSAMVHTGVTTGCNACHENGKVWANLSTLYPIKPSTFTSGATYTGFHTRPVTGATTTSVADGSHPGLNVGDCSDCHGSTSNFSAVAKPTNHIPTSTTAQCQNCHTNLTATGGGFVNSTIDFSVRPTLTNIHAYAPSTTSNCAQCHSTANAAKYAIASLGFVIKSPGSVANHIPYGAIACETCHVYTGGPLTTPVRDGSTFGGGKFSHAGFTTGCATCHGAGVTNATFYGVTQIVAISASTTTPGNLTHIPYSTGCETCHAATVPSGLVSVTTAVSNTANKFATPLATGTAIHSNSSSFACMTCHERGYQWLGMAKYPHIPATLNLAVPTTAYMGFHTRPGAAATTYGFTNTLHTGGDLDTGDCSNCHAGTSAFTGEGKPAGHMPKSTASCGTCHAAGNYTETGLVRGGLHSGVTVPAAVVAYTATTLASNASCKTCHTVGTGGTSGTAPFAGCATPTNCASPPPITYQPKTVAGIASHIPIKNLSCDSCHVGTTSFAGVGMGNKPAGTTMHNNVMVAGIKCLDCHEDGMRNMWTGLTMTTRTPNKHTTTNRKAPNDCNSSGCHSFNGGFNRGLARPVMRSAQVAPDMGRIRPNLQPGKISRGSLGNSFDHKGVEVGKCKTCHDGKAASGMPARHLMVSTSCDTCHRTSTWLPAQFNHNGVSPNTCQACHNGMSASGRPAGHFNTTRSCDVCHKNMSWTPVNYQHLSPNYVPSPDKLTCVSCHTSNGELMRRQLRGLTRTKPIPVGP